MKKDLIYNKLEELQDAIKDFDLAYETDLDERVYKQESIKFKLSVLIDKIEESLNESEEK